MTQATTPTFVLTLPGSVDLSFAENVYFTLRQNSVSITKNTSDLEINHNVVSVFLSQIDTVKLTSGTAQIQLNWTYPDKSRACSNTNIRDGVTILGVEGTMSGSEDVHAQAKTVTPMTTSQTVLPDSPTYNYLTQVTVNAIPYTETDNASGGKTVTIG